MDIDLWCSNNFTEEHEAGKPNSTYSKTYSRKALEFSYIAVKGSGNTTLTNAVYYLFLTEAWLQVHCFGERLPHS